MCKRHKIFRWPVEASGGADPVRGPGVTYIRFKSTGTMDVEVVILFIALCNLLN